MKIGIMTINSAYNYGCVLQAWSLQRFLEKEGHEAEIINYRIPEIDNVYRLFQKRNKYGNGVLNACYNGVRRLKFRLTQGPRIRKAAKFEHFIGGVMNTTRVFGSFRQLKEERAGDAYDVLITGSDQVWNGTITKGMKPAYFLAFDGTGKKKLAYAASIGKRELMNAEKDFFRRYLREYSSIGVREKSAKRLLAPLTDRPVSVVLDPTLLLEREDFDRLKKPSRFRKPYILVHLIGRDPRVAKIVVPVSEQTGLPVVQNRLKRLYVNELGRFADAGPEEFLGLVEGAELVITNSFHATVFSIVYRKNFITIPHELYPERMENLLQEAGLERHLISSPEELPESAAELMPDYAEVWKRLAIRQEESRNYLRRALGEN